MVGIVGYVSKGNATPEGTLDAMAEQLRHFPHHQREDYGDDLLQVSRVHLGIFGRERQPVFSRDGAWGIVGDGIAYGQGEIEGSSGEEPSGNWLATAVQSFSEKGSQAFAELNGSFSLVVFDKREEKVHLVCDRFATRPIYYWHQGSELAFASESKAILEYPSYRKKLNLVAVSKFFRYGRLCVFGDDTWFEGVRGLPPASVLTFHRGVCEIDRYWDLSYHTDKEATLDEFSERLVRSFRKAVSIRTPVGGLRYSVALSGGLDSRSVLAACRSQDNISAYTFTAPQTREVSIASMVARAVGTKHLVCYLDPESTARYAEDVVWLSDGLEVVGISFLLNAGERLLGSFDVSLDGFALDLTLGGSFLRKNIMDASSLLELAALLDKKFAVFSDSEMKSLLPAEFLGRLGDTAKKEFMSMVWRSAGDTLPDKADYFAIRTRVRNFTIMGHVLSRSFYEDAIPTLDNEFIDVVTSIPASLRNRYTVYRRFLRRLNPLMAKIAYERTGISPNRPFFLWTAAYYMERGFKEWNDSLYRVTKGRIQRLRTNAYLDLSNTLRLSPAWRRLISKTLLRRSSLMYDYGFVRREYVLKLVEEHTSGRRDNRDKILYLITFELILRRFFPNWDGIPSNNPAKGEASVNA